VGLKPAGKNNVRSTRGPSISENLSETIKRRDRRTQHREQLNTWLSDKITDVSG
jgi:hypothetical protein